MEVIELNQRKLYQMVKSLIFRRRMSEAINPLEEEIRNSLLIKGKEEMLSKGLKISIKDDGQIEFNELPPLNLEQLELPFGAQLTKSRKGGKEA